METAAFIFLPDTSPLFTRSRAFLVFIRHSREKEEWVAGEQNFFSGGKPLLTNSGLSRLPAGWPAHLGRKASSGAHGSSTSASNLSVLPSRESQAQTGAAQSVGAGSASHTLLPAPMMSGALIGWGWGCEEKAFRV